MSLRPYLPSNTFLVMVGALVLSGGLVLGAQYVSGPKASPALDPGAAQAAQTADWQQALRDIEAQSGVEVPQAPAAEAVNTLLAQSQSTNLTTQIGRSLLINLSNQNAQGLGQDTPTQEQLIAQATAQINASASTASFASGDLTVVAQSKTAEQAYGNGVISVLMGHPEASAQGTFMALGQASDNQDPGALGALPPIGLGYRAIADALLKTPVPKTLSPLHLQLTNDYAAMAATYPDMQSLITDPLRGIAAVQRYATLMDEAKRILTSIAQALNKDGIIFSKDEPGNAWSGFLST